MPNQQGGKNYKKSKHSTEAARLQEASTNEGQMYGRIIRILGNRNFQVYSNDNRTRICRVCGAMTKRVWLSVGDLVIFSVREFEVSAAVKPADRMKEADRGDIIYKFDQTLVGKAKKLDGINPNLFLQLETADGKLLGEIGERNPELDEKDIFEFEASDDDEEGKGKGEPQLDEGGNPILSSAAPKKGKAKESKHAAAGGAGPDDEMNIDDI
jgi:initiation factor 1A